LLSTGKKRSMKKVRHTSVLIFSVVFMYISAGPSSSFNTTYASDKGVGKKMAIEDVLKRNEERLMAMPGVVGVGIGESEGKPVVIIMVKELTPELKNKLPQNLDGFSVKAEVVGEITAF